MNKFFISILIKPIFSLHNDLLILLLAFFMIKCTLVENVFRNNNNKQLLKKIYFKLYPLILVKPVSIISIFLFD